MGDAAAVRRPESGYTLIELVLAVGLSVVVMTGIFGLLSSMIKFQVENARRTTVDSWAIASIVAMNKEIEESNTLVYPAADLAADDKMLACQNWSNQVAVGGGQMKAGAGVTVVYYCYDSTNHALLRYTPGGALPATCPGIGAMPACSVGAKMNLVATNVYYLNQDSTIKVFTRQNSINGVRLQYQVGVQGVGQTYTPGKAQVVNPQFLQFATRITMARSYLTTSD